MKPDHMKPDHSKPPNTQRPAPARGPAHCPGKPSSRDGGLYCPDCGAWKGSPIRNIPSPERLVDMKNAKNFSIQQHEKNGDSLKKIHGQVIEVIAAVRESYPKSSSVAKYAERTLKAIGSLRSELDNCLSREAGGLDWDQKNLSQIYYGENESR